MDSIVLDVADVGKRRGKVTVLDAINLTAGAGQRIALLGHNGAGKSTLMKSILGLTSIDAGQITVDGNAAGSALARAATAYLPEAVSFHKAITAREQMELFSRLSGVEIRDVPALLQRVGLGDVMDRRIGTFSKGMRQRLGLAQVLLARPKLALLDEPTSGLDPISRYELFAIIDEMAARGTSVLIASHTLTEVEARTDRIAILSKGKLVANDTLGNLSAKAGLQTRVRVRANGTEAGRIAAEIGGTRVNGTSVEVLCGTDGKMAQIRRLAEMGEAVADIELHPPNLEDLYRHFSSGEHP